MPIYAFECAACGHSFDRLQKLSDADPVECPECGQPRIRRQLTAPQFRLAGGGWYETDFKKDGDRKRNLAGDGGGKPGEGKGGEGKGGDAKPADAKPAGGSDAKPAKTETAATKPASKPAA
ncbi:FmdB family zinc ribbon protein [Novilysobacter spongiicola]|uniref:Putative regulatory protein, FmdB family n=1 Tax=Lysobacter spongiicola DSM 21749 TaxID=1122188 RepID=A0A1T4QWZ6_9GAMM|nr:zinc ribbon domain-containing protein [Lysobacter spongiicola]SKA08302.1 putative regulatory protein, FmdB family [Lysobacter spongiicola DSM 21749]